MSTRKKGRDAMSIHRRRILQGGLALGAVAGGLAGTATAATTAMQYYAKVGTQPGWPMRYRYDFGWVNGRYIGLHRAAQSFPFDPVFHATCDSWANYLNAMSLAHFSSTIKLSWFGTGGVGGPKPGSNHDSGNAFDLTAMYWSNGGYVDNYFSHQSGAGPAHNRWYVALAWAGRRYFPELGIVGTGGGHENHIHMGRWKNGSASILLSRTSWDTWLVQYTCKVMTGSTLALDGQWGPQTQTAFNTLLSRLGLTGYNPFVYASNLYAIADRLVARAIAGQAA